mmetsp:Transcript_9376/g.9017  ORF Transcript_9376/g.9017 Transcript_9376/m.9017 type:complete len:90 (+) Transcript_9376:946-1215(+)
MKASIIMNIWGFGVIMNTLCTDKNSLFRCNDTDDTFDGEDETNRLLSWKEPTEKDLKNLLPYCIYVAKENTEIFSIKLFMSKKQNNFQT